jgi:hypothetical protein
VEGNPFNILSKSKAPLWWESDGSKDSFTIGLIVFMVVMSILSTLTQLIKF